jgi:hypothetical protein
VRGAYWKAATCAGEDLIEQAPAGIEALKGFRHLLI